MIKYISQVKYIYKVIGKDNKIIEIEGNDTKENRASCYCAAIIKAKTHAIQLINIIDNEPIGGSIQ